jgi:RHS repeat-associated protein
MALNFISGLPSGAKGQSHFSRRGAVSACGIERIARELGRNLDNVKGRNVFVKGIRLVGFALVMLLAVGCGIALAEQDDGESQGVEAPTPVREIEDARTADSQTFVLSNGQREARIYSNQVNYRDGDEWSPVGEALHETSTQALTNGPNDFDVTLPKQIDSSPVRLSVGDDWVSSQLLSADTEAVELEGKVANYEGGGGAPSFELKSLANGLKEDIVLAGRSQPSKFSYLLKSSAGLAPRRNQDGSIAFLDGEEKRVFVLPAPIMLDSRPGLPTISDEIEYELSDRGAGEWLLKIEADREWIESPERVLPIRLDPSLTVPSPSLDCDYLLYNASTSVNVGCGSTGFNKLRAQYKPAYNGAAQERERSVLKFDTSSIPSGVVITEATVGLFAPYEPLNISGIELRRLTQSWDSGVTWTKATGGTSWTSAGGTFNTEGAEILASEQKKLEGWWSFNKGLAPIVQGWVSGTMSNQGLLIKLRNEEGCSPPACTNSWAAFNSGAATDSAKRPYLSVLYEAKAPATSKLISPTEGTQTARRLKLVPEWGNFHIGEVSGITFQYRLGSESEFKDIPASAVTDSQGKAVIWPALAPKEMNPGPPFYFDTAAIVDGEGKAITGEIDVRAKFYGTPAVAGITEPVKVTIDRSMGSPHDATAQVGPGTVNLMTGNFAITQTDVSIPGMTTGLTFARSHSSRMPGIAEDKSVLGRGWKPSVPVEIAGGSEWRSVRDITATPQEVEEGYGDYALLTDLEGYEYAFEKEGGVYVSPPEAGGWVLTHPTGTTFKLSDPSGSVTTFDNGSGGNEYLPSAVTIPGSVNKSTVVYKYFNGVRRLDSVISPTAPGITCTNEALSQLGCRALSFAYAPASKWGAPASYGDRLVRITYWSANNGAQGGNRDVAEYEYDSAGRLIAEWNPSIGSSCTSEQKNCLKEKYTYVGSGGSTPQGGQIATITPPGQEPWTLEYSALAKDSTAAGRLKSVKRASLVASPTVAQTTIAYEVPVKGSGAPYVMSGEEVAKWGQVDIPMDATAIFPPDEVPSSPPSKYSRATVYYMDGNGEQVNVATPAGAGTSAPSIVTTEPDGYGHVKRELTPENRLRALAAGAESASRSHELETLRDYSLNWVSLQWEMGPAHQMILDSGKSVTGRVYKEVEYDKDWPGIGAKPYLPTKETTFAWVPGFAYEEFDRRVTVTKYDWTLRKPIETIVDPEGLNLRARTSYDAATGLPVETSSPAKPGGGDAHTTVYEYYYNTPFGKTEGNTCSTFVQNKMGYAGLLCRVRPAAQPGTSGQPELPVRRVASYSPYLQPTEVIESPGGKEEVTRKTTTTVDAAGRPITQKREGGGTTLPPMQTVYNQGTGLPEEQKFACEGCDTQSVVIAYDKLGRPIQSTDADANTSKVTYDLLGRPATTSDGKGTQTYGYDATVGLLTKLEDSAAGTFTAAYDANGNMVEEGLPNGLVAKAAIDEAGQTTGLTYTKVTSCTEKCVWLEESNERSAYGQILSQKSLGSSQQYGYDKAGRLTLVQDTPLGGGCTTRAYEYDEDSNRKALRTRPPGAGGVCDTKSAVTPQEYTYDAADRLTGEGVVYDNFGRITSLPAKYAGGSTLATSFYSNEMVATQSQDGLTNSYQLDAMGRPREVVQSGSKSGKEVFHYAMSIDSTAWTERGATWTRSITGIGGGLSAIQESSGTTTLQLANLHGDIVATASLSPTAKEPIANFEFDEFGNPKKGTAGRFGWLGSSSRRAELPSGVIQMGVRSYIPTLGRFISIDPVTGGSASAYDYANADPVNQTDLDGRAAKGRAKIGVAQRRAVSSPQGSGGVATGSSGPAATYSAPERKKRNPFKTKPLHRIGCTIGPSIGGAITYPNGWTMLAMKMPFSCNEAIVIGGYLKSSSHTSPVIWIEGQEKGELPMALGFYIWEGVAYCISAGNGHDSFHLCEPVYLIITN